MERVKGVIIDDFKKEQKRRERREWFQRKGQEFKSFFYNNKEMIFFITPIGLAAIGGVSKGIKLIVKRSNLNKEEKIKNNYCYDRSLGHYWALRRELTNEEWLEIDRRKRDGERLADILEQLKVLK